MQEEKRNQDFTGWLGRWRAGEATAQDRLVELVYDELRRLARSYMRREREGHTLQGTALVHEALLRLLGRRHDFKDRAHFFRAAAMAMRRILVDHARRLEAGHRISPRDRLSLDAAAPIALPLDALPKVDLLDLDHALERLQHLDPNLSRIVELRCFTGLTLPEIAAVQGVSPSTVSREWKHAKAWLRQHLEGRANGP
ncbi:MAG: sigma-70 family RNA polymerase sigma factor [Acidobacteria bacterium]|nr:sigma-70 family RNA polymerase sigma factor [Acidobacteriota bacterium]